MPKLQWDCTKENVIPLIVNANVAPNINAEAVENNIIKCPGEFAQLISKFGPPTVQVKWTSTNSENIISDVDGVSTIISGLMPGINTILLDYSIDGCTNFSRDTISIYMEYSPQASNDEYILDYGQNGIFNVLQNDLVPDGGILSISAEPKHGTLKINGNLISFTPDPRYIEPTTFTYKICADFCSELCDEALVNIAFNENILCKVPNIFTPNNDGINDQFVIPCLSNDRYPDNKVIIFNEWGQEVFLGNPYRNDWEGTYGGNPIPVGTYFYILDIGDGQKPLNGFIILQR
ncbi:MAG: gliding motility-associated C-terminal domain-containing protein [Saprospiraceae bacterium]|nr:gliding motility-associated C-terminal domain-containing protein [Saprospiraceae bacterium]